jgi:hypothetical protein
MQKINQSWRLILPALIPLVYFVLVTIIMPRPYYIQPADLEQDYYYGSKLVNDGYPPYGIHHPGTPIYELGALIMKISGDQIENTQTFFNISYFFIAVANIIALFVFSKVPEVKKKWGVLILALLMVVSLPGWLSYSHTFGADSFLTPVVLIMLSIFWISLDLSYLRRMIAWIGVSIVAGLGLAIKLSVLPIWAAVVICSILFASLSRKKDKQEHRGVWIQFILIPIISGISFLLFILPTFARLPQIFINFFQRDEIHLTVNLTIIKNIVSLLSTSPYLIPIYAMVIVSGIVLIISIGKSLHKSIRSKQPVDHKYLTKASLLLIMLICLGYSILGITVLEKDFITELFDPGITLRNSIPASLFLPFAILFIADPISPKQTSSFKKEWAAAALGVAVFGCAWFGYLNHRLQFIQYEEQMVADTTSLIRAYSSSNARVAVWDGSPGNLYGEASFHFWGNFNYAREFYDTELLAYFPDLTFLKLREIPQLPEYSEETTTTSNWLSLWKRLFPSPYYMPPNSEMVMGENREEPISAIAVPESEIYNEGTTLDELSQMVSQRFGAYRLVERTIDNQDWIIFELSVSE